MLSSTNKPSRENGHNISFELTLRERASGAKANRGPTAIEPKESGWPRSSIHRYAVLVEFTLLRVLFRSAPSPTSAVTSKIKNTCVFRQD